MTRRKRLARRIEQGLGLRCVVEDLDGLALLCPDGDPAPFLSTESRSSLVSLARDEGFLQVAIELADLLGDGNASLHRD